MCGDFSPMEFGCPTLDAENPAIHVSTSLCLASGETTASHHEPGSAPARNTMTETSNRDRRAERPADGVIATVRSDRRSFLARAVGTAGTFALAASRPGRAALARATIATVTSPTSDPRNADAFAPNRVNSQLKHVAATHDRPSGSGSGLGLRRLRTNRLAILCVVASVSMPVFSQEAELPIVYIADDSEGSRSANTAGAEREPESIAKDLARAARAVVPRTGMSDPLRLVVDTGGRPLVRKEPSGVPKAASEDRASPESVASSATVARRYQFDDGTFEAGIDSQGYIRQTAQRFQLQATGTVQWIEACFWRALADANPDVAAVYYVHYDRGGRPGEALRDGVLAQGTVPADQEDSCLRRSVAVPVSERTVWVSVAYYGDFGVEYEDIEGFGKYLSVDTDTAGRTAVLIRDIDESDEVTNWRTPSEYAAGSVGIRIRNPGGRWFRGNRRVLRGQCAV